MKKLTILLLLLSTGNVFSQEQQDSAKSNWTGLGFGVDNNGISGQLGIDWSNNSQLYRFRYLGSVEIFFLGDKSPRQYLNDIGFLVGKLFYRKQIKFVVSGGVGVVFGTKRGEYLYSDGELFGTQYYEEKKF